MSEPLIPADFERAIALGLSRAPLKTGDDSALTTLALAAQRKRHRRHAGTGATGVKTRLHEDSRPLMPDAARRPLMRLGTSLPKDGWSQLGNAVFDRLEARGVRLHPFDLPKLEGLLQACPDRIGTAERVWLGLRRSSSVEQVPADTPSNSENDWALLPKAQKAAAIRQLRAKDADTARGWVERHVATAPADVRAAVVEALEVGLSAADTPLLERLAKEDRAASVRDAALEHLSATPGTEAYEAKLAKAITVIEAGKTMLGRRTVKLNAAELTKQLDLPANAATGTRNLAAAEKLHRMFKNLAFSDVARALSLSPAELAGALTADDGLAAPLAIAGLTGGDPAVAAKLAPHLAKMNLHELVSKFGQLLLNLAPADRASILDTLAPNILQWRWAHELQWLGRMAGGVVSDALARKLLSGGVWKSAEAQNVDSVTYATFASIMPPGRDAEFAAAIADLPRKETAAAYEFIAFDTALKESAT
jgi:hypothetical protein